MDRRVRRIPPVERGMRREKGRMEGEKREEEEERKWQERREEIRKEGKKREKAERNIEHSCRTDGERQQCDLIRIK